ncbi:HamA C-terminal domain-containing protein [Clostridium autoethanogenum]|nr:DUF1837 domain-containing protein [Clostridium autoethanogenum]
MHRVVRIEIKDKNVGTGLLISLDNDKNRDVILTVCHIFGENKGDHWEKWDITKDDVQIISDYYPSLEFEVTDVLYKEGDAAEKDFALIYVKKIDGVIDKANPYIPENDKAFLKCDVVLEGYGREEENNTSRVVYGVLYDFINSERKLYRVNYTENDHVSNLTSAEINKGMSGAPVYSKYNDYFLGMQKMVPSEKSTDGILGIFTYKYCLEQVKCLYQIELPLKCKTNKLINNDSLFKNIHVIKQKFDILPKDNEHIGASIEYQDLSEMRKDFLNELIYTMIDWVYCSEKFEKLKQKSIDNGKTEAAACSEIQHKVYRQFRKNENGKLFAQGQIGELLLFHFIQRYLKAVPLLRKQQIEKSSNNKSTCADVIHYKTENGKNIIVLGESKSFTSAYNFNQAFAEAIDSILYAYNRHREELPLYIHEDFLDKEMDLVAESYLNNTMKNIEIHLVVIVIYNETQKLNITNEDDIKGQIDSIIKDRYSEFNNKDIHIDDNPILNRITYILFPIWKIEELAKGFQELL